MASQNLSPHEALEIHELLSFKTNHFIKTRFLQNCVQDQDLKLLLEKDIDLSARALNELQEVSR